MIQQEIKSLQNRVLKLAHNSEDFDHLALDVFNFQAKYCVVYKAYLQALNVIPEKITDWKDIPYLPIQFFKTHQVKSGEWPAQTYFESSGTTGTSASRHNFLDVALYKELSVLGFQQLVGNNPADYSIYALLPNYLERGGSSLVFMADHFIGLNEQGSGGFYLNEFAKLKEDIELKITAGQKVLLLGVSFALLNFVEKYKVNWPEVTIMETGGMKGKRAELTRAELHDLLKNGFGTEAIASEYGMTELSSQAYAITDGWFKTPAWMKVRVRETNDPFNYLPAGRTGGLNVIDLANVHSCAFIETEDLAVCRPDGAFSVLGRYDYAEARGCNLMVSNL